MKSDLLKKIKSEFKTSEVIILPNQKYLIKDCLYKGISLEIMVNNSNDFVIRFGKFEFFDKKSLENYFKKKLAYKDVGFKVNSYRIYVYVNHKKDDTFRYEVFKYIVAEIENIISEILNTLNG